MANLIGYGALGAQTPVLDTELNSLAAAAFSAASDETYDNTTTAALYGHAELAITFGSAPTAGGTVDLYLLDSQDGTTFADVPVAGAIPQGAFCGSFVVKSVTTAQKLHIPQFPFPAACKMVFCVQNNTSQAFPASGTTVKIAASKLNDNL